MVPQKELKPVLLAHLRRLGGGITIDVERDRAAASMVVHADGDLRPAEVKPDGEAPLV